jgi:NADPH-dependent 2,4-dienoyl-CoA reductase/sulfur reductase-like enzyme/ferredoxin
VRNGYCEPCLGCQKNCYDFNPRAAILADIHDDDPRYAGQRRFFMGMMPGMVLGYYLQGPSPAYSELLHAAIFVAATLTSVGLYQLVTSFFRLEQFRTANAFAAFAVALYYYFTGPIIVATVSGLLDIAAPDIATLASSCFGIPLALIVLVQGWRNEHLFRAMSEEAHRARVDQTGIALKNRLEASTGPRVTEARSGESFPIASNQTLLEAIEAARIKINFGCRTGMCGADPVAIVDGMENLSPPGEDELTTLRRLGFEGGARLACMCHVSGPIVINLDASSAPRPVKVDSTTVGAAPDPAAALGIKRVVIIGNGVAGLGVAEALRRESPSVEIVVITNEQHHFYNRMAIGRLIYGRAAMDGLYLLPDAWYADNRIDVWRNTFVTAIDRTAGTVICGTGESLSYDRLVIATGARAASPGPGYLGKPNAFVLRDSADAAAIRARIQTHGARKAVVIGGGVLGIEAADALRHLGLQVVVLQRSGRLMDRQLDEEGARLLTTYLENMGVAVRAHAVVESFEGADVLERVRLADGESIAGDLFVATVGAVPNAELAKSCGIAVGRGVIVDPTMRTSDANVFAVGDVAELPGAANGLWPVGALQASTAARAMLGDSRPYEPPRLLLQLKCDGIDLRSYGQPEPRPGDACVTARQDEGLWWRLVIRDGALAGAVFVGPPGSARTFTKLTKDGVVPGEIQAALEARPRADA